MISINKKIKDILLISGVLIYLGAGSMSIVGNGIYTSHFLNKHEKIYGIKVTRDLAEKIIEEVESASLVKRVFFNMKSKIAENYLEKTKDL